MFDKIILFPLFANGTHFVKNSWCKYFIALNMQISFVFIAFQILFGFLNLLLLLVIYFKDIFNLTSLYLLTFFMT